MPSIAKGHVEICKLVVCKTCLFAPAAFSTRSTVTNLDFEVFFVLLELIMLVWHT